MYRDRLCKPQVALYQQVPALQTRSAGEWRTIKRIVLTDPSFAIDLHQTGLEVHDIETSEEFARRVPHTRDAGLQLMAMRRLAESFLNETETPVQALVEAAVDLCGADSAGVSVQRPDKPESEFWHWLATAGDYTPFTNAVLPRHPSACGVCVARGGPQLFRVNQRFFDIMGIEAPLITDGLLLPWNVEGMRGTIFVMAHGRREAFDFQDLQLMQLLAEFAGFAVRAQRQQKVEIAAATASAEMNLARELAHQVNNPLQSLTNSVYISEVRAQSPQQRALVRHMKSDVDRLSRLVKQLLLPIDPSQAN